MRPLTTTTPTCSTNTSPTITEFNFGSEANGTVGTPGEPVATNVPVTATVTFTDADAESHTADWNWNDPLQPSTIADSFTVAAGDPPTVTSTHTYATPGVYTVTAKVADACGTTAANRLLAVYDPTAGFVTGGGWIVSPAGASPAMPNLTGRANFGFVSKYLKGATTPIGQTEFQFQAGDLNFHSESYDWLVVASARAQFKGSGTINGVGGYKFLLTAVDGQLLEPAKKEDRFRIKIWHPDASSGQEVVDYDNDASAAGTSDDGTALGGGSIVIHK